MELLKVDFLDFTCCCQSLGFGWLAEQSPLFLNTSRVFLKFTNLATSEATRTFTFWL